MRHIAFAVTRLGLPSKHFAALASTAALLSLAACGGGGGGDANVRPPAPEVLPVATPGERLNSQPTLAMVNANDAYARRLTGSGVRIGIDDDFVEVGNDEFAGRIGLEGARFTYLDPYGATRCEQAENRCRVFDVAAHDDIAREARRIIERDGYPQRNNSWYVRVRGENDLVAWHEIPAVSQSSRTHGTAVASVAAGRTIGIAPGATIVPMARPFDDDLENQQAISDVWTAIQIVIAVAGPTHPDVRTADRDNAQTLLDTHKSVDVINRSYGTGAADNWNLYYQHLDADISERWIRNNLPRTYGMLTQGDVPEQDQTIIVYAAGNDHLFAPSSSAGRPLRIPELRGLQLAAAALNEAGTLASYSNRCGPLSQDWNRARDGRHYCLSAPGNVKGALARTERIAQLRGTSLAAPMVAGGAALVMEAFRGQLTTREVGLRLVNTADNSGVYADALTYGAGVMDLEAATRPIGTLSTGTAAVSAPLALTRLRTPASWGNVAARIQGIEAAAYDRHNAPFWHDPAAFFESTRTSFAGVPTPATQGGAPRAGPLAHFRWADRLTPNTWGEEHGLQVTAYAEPGLGDAPMARETFGLSMPISQLLGTTLRTGFVIERGSNQGAQPSGAFGSEANANMAWVEAHRQWALDGDRGHWSLQTEGLLAMGHPEYQAGAMFEATTGIYSAAALSLVHRDGQTSRTRLRAEQPLRAESGKGTLTYSSGREMNGTRRYTRTSFPLTPKARALRVSLRHDRGTDPGEIAIELTHTLNAGHVRNSEDTTIGVAYHLEW